MIAFTSEFIGMGVFAAVLFAIVAFLFYCVIQMEREERRR